jgi:hypothetical protein
MFPAARHCVVFDPVYVTDSTGKKKKRQYSLSVEDLIKVSKHNYFI